MYIQIKKEALPPQQGFHLLGGQTTLPLLPLLYAKCSPVSRMPTENLAVSERGMVQRKKCRILPRLRRHGRRRFRSCTREEAPLGNQCAHRERAKRRSTCRTHGVRKARGEAGQGREEGRTQRSRAKVRRRLRRSRHGAMKSQQKEEPQMAQNPRERVSRVIRSH